MNNKEDKLEFEDVRVGIGEAPSEVLHIEGPGNVGLNVMEPNQLIHVTKDQNAKDNQPKNG